MKNILVTLVLFVAFNGMTHAQDATPTPTPDFKQVLREAALQELPERFPRPQLLDTRYEPIPERTETTSDVRPATGYIETQTVSGRNQKPTHQINAYVSKPINDTWGMYGWGQTSQFYSQAYGGLTYQVNDHMQIGGAFGFEQAKNPLRGAAFIVASKEKVSNTFIVETGGSGQWFQDKFLVTVSEGVQIGFHTERSLGSGGTVELTPPQSNFTVYGGAYGGYGFKLSGGIRLSF